MGQIWEELLWALGIQCLLTSPYHLERNAVNERSNRVMIDMLHVLLYVSIPTPHWVYKTLSIMLTVIAMPHRSHGYSVAMITTGYGTTLPLIESQVPNPWMALTLSPLK